MEQEYLRILNRLRNLCARREYCSADIYKKAVIALEKLALSGAMEMSESEIDENEVTRGKIEVKKEEQRLKIEVVAREIVEALKQDSYVDDSRYAAAYAREKSSISGWGVNKIKYALASKSLSKEDIAKGLNEIDKSKADTRLEKLLLNKYRSLKDDPMCKQKLIRFAMGRGYSYEEINLHLKSDLFVKQTAKLK